MICNRQIYIFFFSSQKPPNNTRPQKKGREWKKEWGPAKTLVSGDSLILTPQAHAHSHIHTYKYMRYWSHANILFLTFTYRKQESLWGHCVIPMYPSLVVKTAKHRMLGLHAAIPPEQGNHGERWGGHSDDEPLEWRGGWTNMYRCWYFKSWNWFSPLFSDGTRYKECTEWGIC